MQKDVSAQSILRTMLSIIYKTVLVWTQHKFCTRVREKGSISLIPGIVMEKHRSSKNLMVFGFLSCYSLVFVYKWAGRTNRAITKAIENSFPNAKRRLCTKHLKDNVKHYLQNRVGVNTT
jgi:hypothetical protein